MEDTHDIGGTYDIGGSNYYSVCLIHNSRQLRNNFSFLDRFHSLFFCPLLHFFPLTMSDIPLSTSTSKPGSSITVTPTKQFDNQSDFKDYILSSLYQAKEYHEFVFIDVPSSWGEAVLRLIDESIPSR